MLYDKKYIESLNIVRKALTTIALCVFFGQMVIDLSAANILSNLMALTAFLLVCGAVFSRHNNGIGAALSATVIFLMISANSLAGPSSFAQDHHDDHHDAYVHHEEWKKGYHMPPNDWGRGQRVDYRRYHLHAPPRGYEWRSVDGNYVMAAVATGVIASVVAASAGR